MVKNSRQQCARSQNIIETKNNKLIMKTACIKKHKPGCYRTERNQQQRDGAGEASHSNDRRVEHVSHLLQTQRSIQWTKVEVSLGDVV